MKLLKWCVNYIDVRTRTTFTNLQLLKFMAVVLGLCHFILCAMFWYVHVYSLVVFNSFSMLVYLLCFCISNQNNPFLYYSIEYAEVLLCVVISSILVGIKTDFSLYLLAFVPIDYLCYYLEYCTNTDKKRFFHPLLFTIISMAAYAFLQVYDYFFGYVIWISDSACKMFSVTNYVITIVSLVFAGSILITQILALRDDLLKQNKLLEIMSTTDTLTGLSNRRIIDQYFQQFTQTSQGFSTIIADIDDFKKVNDTYGHDCGDKVLITVASIFRNSLRSNDIVCRWGGEEILVVLPNCNLKEAAKTASRIQSSILNTPVIYESQKIPLSMTFGVASSAEEPEPEKLVLVADARLYYGKTHGKNCVISE